MDRIQDVKVVEGTCCFCLEEAVYNEDYKKKIDSDVIEFYDGEYNHHFCLKHLKQMVKVLEEFNNDAKSEKE